MVDAHREVGQTAPPVLANRVGVGAGGVPAALHESAHDDDPVTGERRRYLRSGLGQGSMALPPLDDGRGRAGNEHEAERRGPEASSPETP